MAHIGTRRALLYKPPAAASAGWWEVAGQTCVAAYQPKGAANLAASYVNLANPGTYNAAPGVAPAFDAGTGWTFNGSSTWLNSGIVPTVNHSILVRFSDGPSANNYLCGATAADTVSFYLRPDDGFNERIYHNAGDRTVAGRATAGVMGMAGKATYLDGSSDGAIGAGTKEWTIPLYIGARNYEGFGANSPTSAKIQAVAIYSTTLTAPQMATVSAAMAAL